MPFGRRQALGIAGMVLAILGGVAWFYGQQIPGIIAWVGAFILALRLNKKKKRVAKT
ncbi:MAG TPA: hypothetical protein VJP79_04625 [Nitrososphaera sp.]|jgi:hypothetical protein|nr:hypothetical protein [Nitrososphaera sp.]